MSACARLLLLAALPALIGEWWCVEGEVVSAGGAGAGEGPQFAARQRTAVTVAAERAGGGGAALACRVLRLHDKTVSWVRSRDLQIVCHAGASFTADARVSCDASRDARGAGTLHALRVARPRLADSGLYECQVNTEPKMSLLFNLTVVDEEVPHVVVEAGDGDEGEVVRGAAGGAATLACAARYEPAPRLLPAPPLHVAWSRGDTQPVEVRSARGGGVSLESEAAERGARVTSRLTLTALRPADAGRYTCIAGNVSATVTLHVIDDGDKDDDDDDLLDPDLEPALEAMQRDEARAHGGAAGGAHARAVLVLVLLLAPAPVARSVLS